MKRTNRVLFLVAVVAFAVIARSASAQFSTTQPDHIVSLAAFEAVQKDLGVSGDFASKLTSLRDEFQAAFQKEYQDAGINSGRPTVEQRPKYFEIIRKVNDEFALKAKELFTAEQYKRLQQIQLQYRLNLRGPMALLAPDVASELKLSNGQKQDLDILGNQFRLTPINGGKSRADVESSMNLRKEYTTKATEKLKAEQKETLNKLKGNEFDLSQLRLAFRAPPPPPPTGNAAARPATAQQKGSSFTPPDQVPEQLRLDNIVRLAAIEAVQKDLGVGDDVAHKLTLLHNDYQTANKMESEKAGIRPPGPGRVTDEERQKIMEIRGRLNNEFIPKATELLSADQVKRFQQIQLQGRLRTGPRALLAPDLASELKLTDDQKQSLAALHTEMRGKQFPGGLGSPGRVGLELRKVEQEYAAKAVEVLTVEQKEAFNKLKGNEFDVSKLPPQ